MAIVVKDYTCPTFSRLLIDHERRNLISLTEHFLFGKQSIDIHTVFEDLIRDLTAFFDSNKGDYFIRLSTLSPKDACLALVCNNNEDAVVPLADRLNVLRVNTALQCMLVLSHSYRALEEIENNCIPQSIELLPWVQVNHITEVRVFIQNNVIRAISQYYVDDFPTFPLDISYFKRVCHFVTNLDLSFNTVCADVGLTESNEMILIELNAIDNDLDFILFDSCPIDVIEPITIRYLVDGCVVQIVDSI